MKARQTEEKKEREGAHVAEELLGCSHRSALWRGG